jgi:nitrogenase molybdenum-iron protein beta chain
MTEDAAVFGGLNNMIDGLANTYNMYKPKMISVSTTCMAEVIGDDLNAFIKTAKEKGSVPQEFNVPFAHTRAFVGSHISGYDNVMKGVFEHFWDGKAKTAPVLERVPNEKINFIGGFDGYTVGNLHEIKRIFKSMDVDYTILGDNSDVWDTDRRRVPACMTAARRSRRRPMRSTPRRPFRCRNTAPKRRCRISPRKVRRPSPSTIRAASRAPTNS